MTEENQDWWEKLKPIREHGNGQRIWQYFARETENGWEYVIFARYDDGEPISATVFANGTVEVFEYE